MQLESPIAHNILHRYPVAGRYAVTLNGRDYRVDFVDVSSHREGLGRVHVYLVRQTKAGRDYKASANDATRWVTLWATATLTEGEQALAAVVYEALRNIWCTGDPIPAGHRPAENEHGQLVIVPIDDPSCAQCGSPRSSYRHKSLDDGHKFEHAPVADLNLGDSVRVATRVGVVAAVEEREVGVKFPDRAGVQFLPRTEVEPEEFAADWSGARREVPVCEAVAGQRLLEIDGLKIGDPGEGALIEWVRVHGSDTELTIWTPFTMINVVVQSSKGVVVR